MGKVPVILARDDYDLWLDPGMTNVKALYDLLRPFDGSLMRAYPVSSRVHQVANDTRPAQFRLTSPRNRPDSFGVRSSNPL